MPREEEVQYEQDRLGNENRVLDQLRAQEGMAGADADDEGIEEVSTAETGSDLTVYSIPTHADRVYLDLIHAHNSSGTDDTFQLFALDLDGSGNITGTTRRSVPINVAAGATRAIGYEGIEFERAIGVNSQFAGQIGVGVIVDHDEESEPDTEVTQTP